MIEITEENFKELRNLVGNNCLSTSTPARQLQRLIANHRASQWRSVEDVELKNHKRVLVSVNDIISSWVDVVNVYVCPEYGNVIFEDSEGEDYIPIVDKWTPLPEPSTSKGRE